MLIWSEDNPVRSDWWQAGEMDELWQYQIKMVVPEGWYMVPNSSQVLIYRHRSFVVPFCGNQKESIYYKLLIWGQMLDSTICWKLLELLKYANDQRPPELGKNKSVVSQQDDKTLHTSLQTCQRLAELCPEALSLPPNSPNSALSENLLFLSNANDLADVKVDLWDAYEKGLSIIFDIKEEGFYKRSII